MIGKAGFAGFVSLFLLVFAATGLEAEEAVIAGRPTDHSVTLRIIPDRETAGTLSYSSERGLEGNQSFSASPENPAEIVLKNLSPSTAYFYSTGDSEGVFHTAREPGESFTFAVQSDSHLLNKADPSVYKATLEGIAAARPDLFFDLGDTFLNDKLKITDRNSVKNSYIQQLPYLGIVSKYAPIFLVLGNHEGEYGFLNDGTDSSLPVLSAQERKLYYPNPEPDDFYSGNEKPEPFIGLPQNYYAFTWGDVLFVAIDPYRYSVRNQAETKNIWDWTLGDDQYYWLEETLERSDAKWKILMTHHVLGNVRGGSTASTLGEWGESRLFTENRPQWDRPVAQLLEETGVSMVLQGHDHLFSREQVGSVVYQTLPKPAEKTPDRECNVDAYPEGDNLVNSGYLLFHVTPEDITVEYHRTYNAGTGEEGENNPVYRYRVSEPGRVEVLNRKDDSAAFQAYMSYEEPEKSGESRGQKGRKNGAPEYTKGVPEFSGDLKGGVLLGKPDDTSISLSYIPEGEGLWVVAYGEKEGAPDRKSEPLPVTAGVPVTVTLEGLDPGREYFYQIISPVSGQTGRFVTARPEGKSFTFLIEADPHLDENSSGAAYGAVLERMAEEKADFIVDLGDASMAEKLASTAEEMDMRNRLLRSWWDNIGSSLPFFMVLGNHDGEHGWPSRGSHPDSDYAASLRRTYFPNPDPAESSFYSGLTDLSYAWQWGDALFIVLDPYSFNSSRPKDNWDWTLGRTQYDWIASLLEKSTAAHRFVFIHQIGGSLGESNRSGAVGAGLYEWGGNTPDGEYLFDQKRPDWSLPVHDLLVSGGVDAVFHGHDHFFAREEKDGVIYQLVPQPSVAQAKDVSEDAREYGYREGVFLSSPGYLRCSVSPDKTVIDFLQSGRNEPVYSYTIEK